MKARTHTATAAAIIALLALAGCAGDSEPDTTDDGTPDIVAPPPTTAPEEPDESEEPEFPEFDSVDTSGWTLRETEDDQGSLLVPRGWRWEWSWEWQQGVPDGQLVDTITLSDGGDQMLVFQDAVEPPEQCTGDGEAVLLDLAELPADNNLSLVAVAVPDGDDVQFGAGLIETNRTDALSCGVSFFMTDRDLPARFSTTAQLPDSSIDSQWEFDSVDDARGFLDSDEYELLRASLLSFTP